MPYNMVMVIMVLKSSLKSPTRNEKSISIKQMQPSRGERAAQPALNPLEWTNKKQKNTQAEKERIEIKL